MLSSGGFAVVFRQKLRSGQLRVARGWWRRLKLGFGGSILEPAKHEYKLRIRISDGNSQLDRILLTPLVMIGSGKYSSRVDGDLVFRQPTVLTR
ncbi:hypothetical protein CASFOL_017918 [Castilleja foliolosa]|uniref:Uncharacterized protein n=1 Tax=Castilleja foliolosa TaxID=1961234 RepID=A0ABD3D967_9LAMI